MSEISSKVENDSNSSQKVEEKSKIEQLKAKFNPLIATIIFLVIALITVITVLIVLQSGQKTEEHGAVAEKLVYVTVTVRPTTRKIDNWKTTSKINNQRKINNATSGQVQVQNKNQSIICNTPECIHLAHQLNNWRDPNADPCIDFYQATCGRYMQFTSSKGGRSHEKGDIIERLITEFLRTNETSTLRSENNMRQLFWKCQVLKGKNNLKAEMDKALKEVLQNIKSIGSWPLLDQNWDESQFDLPKFLLNMAKMQMNDFGVFMVHRGSRFTIEQSDPGTFEDPDNLKHMVSAILKANGLPVDPKIVIEHVDGAVNFSKAMAQLKDTEYTPVTYAQLLESVPSIHFDMVLDVLVDRNRFPDLKKVQDKIFVRNEGFFFKKSGNIEHLLNITSKKVIADYLILKYISTVYSDIEEDEIFKRDCTKYVIEQFPQATLSLFARLFFDPGNLKFVAKNVDLLKTSFIRMFQNSTWLSQKTRNAAILKIEKMRVFLGLPTEDGWEQRLEQIHEMISISPTETLLATGAKLFRFRLQNYLEFVLAGSLFNPENEHLNANAAYTAFTNSLRMLLPYQGAPHFDDSYPKYAQLATTGKTLGHEMGHGFDRKGMEFDEHGAFIDWWEPADRTEYTKRTDCLVKQYDEFDDRDYGRNLKGSRTIKEMTADQVGLDAAFLTLKSLDMDMEPDIVGFEGHDTDRMFFRIMSLNYCSPPSRLPLKTELQKVHPTHHFRVNGVFRNFQPFADAFKCPVGSPMNPTKKCLIF